MAGIASGQQYQVRPPITPLGSFCKYHSKSELLLVAVYPLIGGMSGNSLRNFASDGFNRSKVEMEFISLGRRFHSCADFTPNEFS